MSEKISLDSSDNFYVFIFCFFIFVTIHIGLFFGARQSKEGK